MPGIIDAEPVDDKPIGVVIPKEKITVEVERVDADTMLRRETKETRIDLIPLKEELEALRRERAALPSETDLLDYGRAMHPFFRDGYLVELRMAELEELLR